MQGPSSGAPEQLLVQQWLGGGIEARGLTVSCIVPQQGPDAAYMVGDAAGLINAIVAAQNFTAGSQGAKLILRQNITFRDLYLYQADVVRLPIAINVTISGVSGGNETVIDWNLMTWVLALYDPSVILTFTNVTMMNISPMRGLVVPNMGYLTLFAIPFWVIW